jgi:hypothetical protein
MMQVTKLVQKSKTFLFMILALLMLMGCSQNPPKTDIIVVETDSNFVCKVPFEPSMPDGFYWRKIEFRVLTPEIMSDILAGNDERGDIVFFALTVDEYEKLSYNVTDIKRVLHQNRLILFEVIDYYKEE